MWLPLSQHWTSKEAFPDIQAFPDIRWALGKQTTGGTYLSETPPCSRPRNRDYPNDFASLSRAPGFPAEEMHIRICTQTAGTAMNASLSHAQCSERATLRTTGPGGRSGTAFALVFEDIHEKAASSRSTPHGLARWDFIIFVCPVLKQTHGMRGAQSFRRGNTDSLAAG